MGHTKGEKRSLPAAHKTTFLRLSWDTKKSIPKNSLCPSQANVHRAGIYLTKNCPLTLTTNVYHERHHESLTRRNRHLGSSDLFPHGSEAAATHIHLSIMHNVLRIRHKP